MVLDPTKGRLLIAEPNILNDKSFNRSVILLSEHNESGSIGFILNKPSEYKLEDLVPELTSEFEVFYGGPVEQDNLYFIHKIPHLLPDSIKISETIYWGGNFKVLTNLLLENKLKTDDIKFFLGYSGWSNDQLDEELKSNSWVVVENSYKNILKVDIKEVWKNNMIKLGGEYLIWANAPKDPILN